MANEARTDSNVIRGLMLDPGRQVERHDFYFRLVDRMAEWGYNTLWWHFCDDEGFALKLDCHGELATPNALSKAQTRRLVRQARAAGIDIVPEVETLGHTYSITSQRKYRHLFNGNPFGHNAICPCRGETIELMGELIREVADLFDSPFLHAGLDESNLGDCPLCARRNKRLGAPWGVFAEHVKKVHEIVASCGKRMVMWADSVEKHPELLSVLPKDTVLAHWHYGDVPKEKFLPSIKAGFDIICVPAISGTVVQPEAKSLKNVDDHLALAGELAGPNCMGIVACWWESFRNIRDTHTFAAAYTGAAISAGRPLAKPAFAKRFCKDHFGLDDAHAAAALWRLHELAFNRSEIKFLMYDSLTDVAEAVQMMREPANQQRAADARQVQRQLQAAARRVRKNADEYAAYILSAELLATVLEHGMKLLSIYTWLSRAATNHELKVPPRIVTDTYLRPALAEMESAVAPLDALVAAVSKEWDRTRYRRDGNKDGSNPLLRQRGARAVLLILRRGRDFHRNLTVSLRKGIAAYLRGGPLPGGL